MPLLAVDTNVLGRALVDDGSEQAKLSRRSMIDNEVFVPDTVLLETEWLLRSRLKMTRQDINALFSGLLAASNAHFADRSKIANSILAHEAGFDFADAMHLFAAKDCDAMITYDEDFIRRSRKISDVIEVRKP